MKPLGSRKQNCPLWKGVAECFFGDVKTDLLLYDTFPASLKICFSGNVNHNIITPKAPKLSGEEKKNARSFLESGTVTPSKAYREKLLHTPQDTIASGNRTGVGTSTRPFKHISSELKRLDGAKPNMFLAESILKVGENVARADEAQAIELKHTHRKMFGYVQHSNVTSNAINIILCSEGSISLYHELCERDIVYLDATGSLFMQPKGYNRALYYALVIRHPQKKWATSSSCGIYINISLSRRY